MTDKEQLSRTDDWQIAKQRLRREPDCYTDETNDWPTRQTDQNNQSTDINVRVYSIQHDQNDKKKAKLKNPFHSRMFGKWLSIVLIVLNGMDSYRLYLPDFCQY